jgi:hypothetical protein
MLYHRDENHIQFWRLLPYLSATDVFEMVTGAGNAPDVPLRAVPYEDTEFDFYSNLLAAPMGNSPILKVRQTYVRIPHSEAN